MILYKQGGDIESIHCSFEEEEASQTNVGGGASPLSIQSKVNKKGVGGRECHCVLVEAVNVNGATIQNRHPNTNHFQHYRHNTILPFDWTKETIIHWTDPHPRHFPEIIMKVFNLLHPII